MARGERGKRDARRDQPDAIGEIKPPARHRDQGRNEQQRTERREIKALHYFPRFIARNVAFVALANLRYIVGSLKPA
jgi:hypothetical protein